MEKRGLAKLWRLGILGIYLAVVGGLFLSIDWKERFATDVSVLLPDTEVEDEAANLLGQLREREEKMILGVLSPPDGGWEGKREEAAQWLLRGLEASGQFSQIGEGAGPSDPEALAAAVYAGRLDLLLPMWAIQAGLSAEEPEPKSWARAIVESLEDFLSRPEATALGGLLAADPFPLAAYMADVAPVEMEGAEDADGPVLWWARQKASPLREEGQEPVFAALREAEKAVLELVPGASLRWAGVAKFAAASEKRMRTEITWLNVGGIFMVGLVAFFFLRRRAMFLHLGAVAALALVGGLTAAVWVFPVVHVLSLVVGGLLVGVAVDYGIHILLHRTERGGFAETLREVRKPLCVSALSTAGGFAALAFADLLLMRQIGVFVAGGLLSALAGCWLYFPLWRRPDLLPVTERTGETLGAPVWLKVLAGLVLVVPLAGWWKMAWRDDVRDLQPPMPELWAEDAWVRAEFFQEGNLVSWLCRGETVAEARRTLTRFEETWKERGGEPAAVFSLAPWIADPEESRELREGLREMERFPEKLAATMQENGLEAEAFRPFFAEWGKWVREEESQYAERVKGVAAELDGPAGMLLSGGDGGWWFLASAPADAVPVGWVAPTGVVSTDQLEDLNDLFAQYRRSAWQLSGVALAVIVGCVVLVYGPVAGAMGLLLPTLAWAWGMGGLFAVFSPLNLFHLLGGFLGFCVALDYGLFLRLATETGKRVPLSIRVSGATTLAAFGVLSCSTIPAVRGLGSSVFAVVLGGVLLVEMYSLWRKGGRGK